MSADKRKAGRPPSGISNEEVGKKGVISSFEDAEVVKDLLKLIDFESAKINPDDKFTPFLEMRAVEIEGVGEETLTMLFDKRRKNIYPPYEIEPSEEASIFFNEVVSTLNTVEDLKIRRASMAQDMEDKEKTFYAEKAKKEIDFRLLMEQEDIIFNRKQTEDRTKLMLLDCEDNRRAHIKELKLLKQMNKCIREFFCSLREKKRKTYRSFGDTQEY
jgi:hypothetical protein